MKNRNRQNAGCLRRERQSPQIAQVHRELRETRDIVERLDSKLGLLVEGVVMHQEEISRIREENRREVAALWSLVRSLKVS